MNVKAVSFVSGLIAVLVFSTGYSNGHAGSSSKPLHGFGTMQMVASAGVVECRAPDGSVVALLPAEFDALARYSVLGLTVGSIFIDRCDLDPGNGALEVTGAAHQTAANGDQVWAPYTGVISPDFSLSLEIEVVGGTGRFENACGAAVSGGMIDLATGTGRTWMDGWISTPAAGGRDGACD